jgi:hypothetical protein
MYTFENLLCKSVILSLLLFRQHLLISQNSHNNHYCERCEQCTRCYKFFKTFFLHIYSPFIIFAKEKGYSLWTMFNKKGGCPLNKIKLKKMGAFLLNDMCLICTLRICH